MLHAKLLVIRARGSGVFQDHCLQLQIAVQLSYPIIHTQSSLPHPIHTHARTLLKAHSKITNGSCCQISMFRRQRIAPPCRAIPQSGKGCTQSNTSLSSRFSTCSVCTGCSIVATQKSGRRLSANRRWMTVTLCCRLAVRWLALAGKQRCPASASTTAVARHHRQASARAEWVSQIDRGLTAYQTSANALADSLSSRHLCPVHCSQPLWMASVAHRPGAAAQPCAAAPAPLL
jgi:hypothetical protein